DFILTRPVPVPAYVGGKIIAHFLFISGSIMIGYAASSLYTFFYFSSVSWSHLLVALSFYLVWVLFIISFTTMMSTIFKSQGFIALMAIVILLGSRLFTNLDLALNIFNPASMSDAAAKVLITGTIDL